MMTTTPELPVIERQVVRVVLLDVLGRLLLFHTREPTAPDLGTWWELPGGGLEAGETHTDAAIREIREEAGVSLEPSQFLSSNWRRSATFRYRGTRRVNHELVLAAKLSVSAPNVDGHGRVAFENEDYFAYRWWPIGEVVTSAARFYPGRLPEIINRFLAGELIEQPFERWS